MRFCLIGYPLVHSISPFIHNKLFELSGISASYRNVEILPDQLNYKDIFTQFDGINVTIPYKTSVISFIDSLEGKAEKLKTVNTIKNEGNKFIGFNTDCVGFLKSLEMSDIELSGKILICGCGGTARMMCCICAENGCDVTISCRNKSINKANALADEVGCLYGCKINVITDLEINNEKYDLLLNGTPAGMYPNNIDILPVSDKTVLNCNAVFDAVYNPKKTKLIKFAEKNNIKTALGMTMLVYQAASAHSIWYGAEFDDADLFIIIDEANKELERSF